MQGLDSYRPTLNPGFSALKLCDLGQIASHCQPQFPHQYDRISPAPAEGLSLAFSEEIAWYRPGAWFAEGTR